jgi:membrane protein DedA with SNARE-associated domain
VPREVIGWYASIFFGLFFTGIGIPPVPEEAGILYAAGLTALHPEVKWWLAWSLAGLGIVCADMALYGIGRATGPRVFEFRLVKRVISDKRRQRIERKFAAHGVKILLLARLLPPLRTGIFIMAGAIRFSFIKFLLADLIYAVVGVGVLFFAGRWVIEWVHLATDWLTAWTGMSVKALVYLAVAMVGLFFLGRYYQYLKFKESQGDPVAEQTPLGEAAIVRAIEAGAAAVEKVDPGPAPPPPKKAPSGH